MQCLNPHVVHKIPAHQIRALIMPFEGDSALHKINIRLSPSLA